MVPGIDSFREKFKDYTDYYTIIGGTACDILLSEADLPFRATKDIDMILIMEDNFPEFASVFWEYIKEGGYKCGWKNEQNMHFYRFTEGKFGYPTMIAFCTLWRSQMRFRAVALRSITAARF